MPHYGLREQRSRYLPQLFFPSHISQWGGSSSTDIVWQGPYCEEGTLKQRCREALLYCMCLFWFDRLMEWVYNGPVWALRLRWSLGLEWVSPTGGSGVLLRWDKPRTTSFCATAFKLTIPGRMARSYSLKTFTYRLLYDSRMHISKSFMHIPGSVNLGSKLDNTYHWFFFLFLS